MVSRSRQRPRRRRPIQCDKRLGGQVCNLFEESGSGVALIAHDGVRCLEREPAGEDTQSAQQAPFRLGQQFVAPVERCAQRLMPRQLPFGPRRSTIRIAHPGGKEPIPVRALRHEPPQNSIASGMPVEAAADGSNRSKVLSLRREAESNALALAMKS